MYGIAVAWYMIGMLVFYTCGVVGSSLWVSSYYLWEKTKDLFLLSAIATRPNNTPYIKSVYVFAALRLVWEILYNVTEWNINNRKAVGILFMLLAVIITYVLCKEYYRWAKQKLRRLS